MNKWIELWVPAGVVFFCVLLAHTTFLRYGFRLSSLMEILVLLVPATVVAIMMLSSIWVGLALVSLPLTFVLPVEILHRIQPAMMICLTIGAVAALQFLLQKRRIAGPKSMQSKCLFACGVLILARFLYDRPGSTTLGEQGGAGEALAFVAGIMSYFLLACIAVQDWDARRNLRVMFVMLPIFSLAFIASGFFVGITNGIMSLYSRPVWFLAPLLLAWIFAAQTPGGGVVVRSVMLQAVALGLAVLAPHRSRPLFAVAGFATVCWAYRRARMMLMFIAIVLSSLLLSFAFLGEEWPLLVSRSLSTILPVSENRVYEQARTYGLSSEVGWSSNFRAQLFAHGWREIKKHPLVGRGFVLSRAELEWASSRSGAVDEAVEGLAVSGCYHNSVLELAVFCGLPPALLFLLAYILGVRICLRTLRDLKDRYMKILLAGTLGFFAAASGQMLMNGGGKDFFYICVLLGVMRGIEVRIEREKLAAEVSHSAVAGNGSSSGSAGGMPQ